jgi:sugar phosphate isomerase/epimerase
MRFGICCEPEFGLVLAEAGYDYIELNVQNHLMPLAAEDEFLPQLDRIRACPLPCAAANCFVPGNLKITGPDADIAALEAYVTSACERARRAGIEKIVFGSGSARQIPEGCARDTAWHQLLEFGQLCGPIAEASNLVIVVEPLNYAECNVLNTVSECARYVREVDHPAVHLLADAFHVARNNENPDDIGMCGDLLRHIHIATYTSRLAPGSEKCNFAPFFTALRKAGYNGDISIECGWDNLADQAENALKELKQAAG